MKFLAFIFSFYLLFLSIEPGVKALYGMEGQPIACCTDISCEPLNDNATANHSDTDENAEGCNPFQFCKCCSFVNRDGNEVAQLPLILFSSNHVAYKENVPPHSSLEFWQPPKIA